MTGTPIYVIESFDVANDEAAWLTRPGRAAASFDTPTAGNSVDECAGFAGELAIGGYLEFTPLPVSLLVVAMWFRPAADGQTVFRFYADGGTVEHVRVVHDDGDGKLRFFNTADLVNPFYEAPVGSTPVGEWHHIFVGLAIGDAGSGLLLYVVDDAIVEFASYDTRNGGTSTDCDYLIIGADNGKALGRIDDLFISAGGGGAYEVAAFRPVADGTHTDWTPQGGGDHFAELDEADLDSAAVPDTATYVSTSADGAVDTYHLAETPRVTSVVGVQTSWYAQGGGGTITPVARIGGVDYLGTPTAVTVGWSYGVDLWAQSPATGLQWGEVEFADAEFGFRYDGAGFADVAQFVVEATIERRLCGDAGLYNMGRLGI